MSSSAWFGGRRPSLRVGEVALRERRCRDAPDVAEAGVTRQLHHLVRREEAEDGVPFSRAPAAARSMPGRTSGSAISIGSVTADDHEKRAADIRLAVWKHYEERIVLVKESFTKTTSLLLGFAVTLLAWGAQHGINWSAGAKDPLNAPLVFIVAAGGLGLTIFAWHITNDAAVHIASNMERANRAAELIPILSRYRR